MDLMRSSTLSATLDLIPVPVRAFVARRVAEGSGILILAISAAYIVALVTWSVRDPSLNHATAGPIRNLLGSKGAIAVEVWNRRREIRLLAQQARRASSLPGFFI